MKKRAARPAPELPSSSYFFFDVPLFVVLVFELLSDWSPVVLLVELLSDWSPVDVVFSIVRLERPRRSMSGWKVEVEPVIEFVELEVDPVTEGLTVVVAELLVEGAVLVAPFVPEAIVPDEVVPAVLPFVPVEVDAWLSGMQSIWTGLAECSFAWPVALSASLPAFG